jgi:hypothetical protein
MCVITPTGSEEFDSTGNPLVTLANLARVARYRAPPKGTGEHTADDMRTKDRPTVWISQVEWYKARDVVSGAAILPMDVNWNVIMAYQYLLPCQKRQLAQLQQ